jgi:hypothetical protein
MVPPAWAAEERTRHRMASENLRMFESLDDGENAVRSIGFSRRTVV